MKKKQRVEAVVIKKLDITGQGVGTFEGRTIRAWNALPGEMVDVEITKRKKGIWEGTAFNITNHSPDRTNPREEHFLSCSPLQIMTWEAENEWKRTTGLQLFATATRWAQEAELVAAGENEAFRYRNKMEYSLYWQDDGSISLAFYKRGQKSRQPITGCLLARPELNQAAQKILGWLNAHHLPRKAVKSIVLRTSREGKVVAAVFMRDRQAFDTLVETDGVLAGFSLYYSDPQSPASRPDELVGRTGTDTLSEEIQGVTLDFGLNSFFQVNVPLFERVLTVMRGFTDCGKEAVDFYSGVGAIGLSLARYFENCTLVDNSEESIGFAQRNITRNGIGNCRPVLTETEKARKLITGEKVVIFDPPRTGIHPKVIKTLLTDKPVRIIYLSCNPVTQAENIGLLLPYYTVRFLQFYNFFPRTPHIESLCILDRSV